MSKRKDTQAAPEETEQAQEMPEQLAPLVGSAIIVPAGGLTFCTPWGSPLLTLTENDYGPCLSLFNNAGVQVAILQAQETGAVLLLRTPDGAQTAQAHVSEVAGGFFSVTRGPQTEIARMEAEEIALSPDLFPAGHTIH